MKNIIYILLLIALSSCKRDPSYIFEVNDVAVTASTGQKNRLKTDIEFVSIAHTDIFGSNISSKDLENIVTTYKSFGDKSLTIEMIIRKFIDDGGVNITAIDKSSNTSIESFVINTYKKLYNREPDAFEKWYLSDLIANDDVINAEMVYFSMMTANEYRYY
tara:strand:- start:138 stop:620 length:483 start_codon:yes stop_codon:yes gene_type:complete